MLGYMLMKVFNLELSISEVIDNYENEFPQFKHFPFTDIVEELCHFVCVWRCVVVTFDVSDSVLSEKGTIK